MEFEIDLSKSVYENASHYFDLAKKMKKKRLGVLDAIRKSEEELSRIEDEVSKEMSKPLKIARKKMWYERFHWFFTSEGLLFILGRSASQSEEIYSKYAGNEDLLFHADIVGAGLGVLKGGRAASVQSLFECAQFSASFSRAWRLGYVSVPVFCSLPENVSKYSSGVFVGKGSFVFGKKEKLFKPELKLRIGLDGETVVVVPFLSEKKLKLEAVLHPGRGKKSKVVGFLSKRFGVHPDDISPLLPPGEIALMV